jgi:hypothetical protein
MRGGVTEHRQQPITLGRTDMAPEAIHDLNHLIAVAPHQHPIGLGLHPSGQHRRIDQIGEQDPLGAFKELKDTADKVLSKPGNTGRAASYLRLPSVGGAITDDAPVWAWEHQGHGAIQLGTLGLLAGHPGAGKSTAARWFGAQFSQGRLPGYWSGQPQNVAYIAPAEESMKYVIKPGLRAAGADLERVFFPEVIDDGKVARLRSARDEDALVEQLLAHNVTVVIVDPLMGTIGTGVDIHRNNETREYLEPWARIADKIGGVVLGVVHLRKEARAVMSLRPLLGPAPSAR